MDSLRVFTCFVGKSCYAFVLKMYSEFSLTFSRCYSLKTHSEFRLFTVLIHEKNKVNITSLKLTVNSTS